MPYDVVLVDELSQLTSKMFTHIIRIWLEHSRRFLLLFTGDFQQLACIDKATPKPGNARKSSYWNLCCHCCLQEASIRVRDLALVAFLTVARSKRPSQSQIDAITIGRTYSVVQDTDLQVAVGAFFLEFPTGIVLTVTKAGTALVNQAAVRLLGQEPLGVFPLWEDDDVAECLLTKNMPVMITRNLDEGHGLVNGAVGRLLGSYAGCVLLQLEDGRIRTVWPISGKAYRGNSYSIKTGFTLIAAYACTVHKVQGATLCAAAIWFESFRNVTVGQGLGYVAASRVRDLASLRFIGQALPCHFTPISTM
jgi:hypothetical protein